MRCLSVKAKGKDYTSINSSIQFAINSSSIEVVNSWPHLGHVISSDINGKSDIERCHSKLVAQINCVLCSFGRDDVNIKTKLLKSYCSSLYGCELWDLCHADIERICKSWRLGLRRTCGLPNDCRTMILQLLSDTLPLLWSDKQMVIVFYKEMSSQREWFSEFCVPLQRSVWWYVVHSWTRCY